MIPGRDMSSGTNLPQWIKSRAIERNDVDGISFSPPPHDESFFYIRYPVQTKISENKVYGTDCKPHSVDFTKHTEPCKKFLINDGIGTTSNEEIKHAQKSFGVDDGFKGSSAACGSSIVKVAQQMVSGKSISSRGFKLMNLIDESSNDDDLFTTKTVEDQQQKSSELIQPQYDLMKSDSGQIQHEKLMIRRGSKSLPSSPLHSPKFGRRILPNPYFTGNFMVTNTNNVEGKSWFLSSLLGIQRASTTSNSSISQINEESNDHFISSSNSIATSTINNNNNNNNNTNEHNQKSLKAKPSELREMNFWSPTSM